MESIRRLVAVFEITRHRITSFSFVEHENKNGVSPSAFQAKSLSVLLDGLQMPVCGHKALKEFFAKHLTRNIRHAVLGGKKWQLKTGRRGLSVR